MCSRLQSKNKRKRNYSSALQRKNPAAGRSLRNSMRCKIGSRGWQHHEAVLISLASQWRFDNRARSRSSWNRRVNVSASNVVVVTWSACHCRRRGIRRSHASVGESVESFRPPPSEGRGCAPNEKTRPIRAVEQSEMCQEREKIAAEFACNGVSFADNCLNSLRGTVESP